MRFVRNHAATTGHDFGQAVIDSFGQAAESLQIVCGAVGMDLQAQFRTDAGSASLLELQGKSKEMSLTIGDLIHGKEPLTDEAAATQIRELIDHAIRLSGAAEAIPQVQPAVALGERSHHLLDCVLGLQGAAEAFDAGRREGLRHRRSPPRTR